MNRVSAVVLTGQVAAFAGVLVLWEFASREGIVDPFFLGAPTDVAAVLSEWWRDGTLIGDTLTTASTLLLGWLIGMSAGLVIGACLYALPRVHEILSPFLALLNSVPRMIFYPFFTLLFGFGLASKVGLVVFVIIVFAILGALQALAEVDSDRIAHVRVIGGTTSTVLTQVYLPSTVGNLVASSRVTFALALQATIISEFFGPAEGLGYRVVAGQGAFDVNQVWAAISLTVVLALVVDRVLDLVRRRFLAWQVAGGGR